MTIYIVHVMYVHSLLNTQGPWTIHIYTHESFQLFQLIYSIRYWRLKLNKPTLLKRLFCNHTSLREELSIDVFKCIFVDDSSGALLKQIKSKML